MVSVAKFTKIISLVTVDKTGGKAVSVCMYWLWKFVSCVRGPGTMQDGVRQTKENMPYTFYNDI